MIGHIVNFSTYKNDKIWATRTFLLTFFTFFFSSSVYALYNVLF